MNGEYKGCCYKCEERKVYQEGNKTVTCHSTCERWKEQKEKNEKKKALIQKQKDKENICKSYANDSKCRTDKWKRYHGL